jgi:menaquinone reductase, multiheme cytochrome c subunit
MSQTAGGGRFVFPEWTNLLRPALAVALVLVPAYIVVLVAFGASPQTTDVGYAPVQPVPLPLLPHHG